jgi:hypothetical protein
MLNLAKRVNCQTGEQKIRNGEETSEESKEEIEGQRRQTWNPDTSAALTGYSKGQERFQEARIVPELLKVRAQERRGTIA